MAVSIGSSTSSFSAQRRLEEATQRISTSFERLSSGMRINKASDDAAGLAIASSLQAKSRIYTQSIRNLNDGLSASYIAEGASRELTGVLIRLR